jgi:hypothetical protein
MKGCLLSMMIVLTLMGACGAWHNAPRHWRFSRSGWRIAPDGSRETMSRDYLATHRVVGTPREDLVADLGRPERAEDRWTYAAEGDSPSAALMPREPALFVEFDREGRVRRLKYANVPEGIAAEEFDSAAWKLPQHREAMAAALSHSRRLARASKLEVRELLGEPDAIEHEYDYMVGVGGSDDVYLEFWFDAEDRVARVRMDDEEID